MDSVEPEGFEILELGGEEGTTEGGGSASLLLLLAEARSHLGDEFGVRFRELFVVLQPKSEASKRNQLDEDERRGDRGSGAESHRAEGSDLELADKSTRVQVFCDQSSVG